MGRHFVQEHPWEPLSLIDRLGLIHDWYKGMISERTGFYDGIERHPTRQATVEVACALEGLNDAYSIAAREGDAERIRAYGRGIRIALAWLFLAQRLEGCTPRERGGFGHSLTDRMQRIDVTGHVLSGFIKSARNRIGA